MRLSFDGRTVEAPAGVTLAAALLGAGVLANRESVVEGRPRGPYCMMGVCHECLVVVDGVPDRQACLVPARDGMRVESQRRDGTAGGHLG